ncbi:hypothetical protein FCL47_12300 [Desulfopila sp. IMCC35006]|uniref:hypothetical protein n=1 Tax=Desulfopila sp. IMCC35006 TaxID=2569542 RepID=UPI0010AB9915|nr:hypothetical protein [Desulfopila sp. IMCC35006]TKB25871.1 hypothetical protein FCL47_12300 [Desulfopila sp. IMCC35006]
MTKENDTKTIAAEIMEYLRQHPMASDTLDGVVYWWLVQQSIIKNKILVEQALEQLTEEGKISKKINLNCVAVYSLKPEQKPSRD